VIKMTASRVCLIISVFCCGINVQVRSAGKIQQNLNTEDIRRNDVVYVTYRLSQSHADPSSVDSITYGVPMAETQLADITAHVLRDPT